MSDALMGGFLVEETEQLADGQLAERPERLTDGRQQRRELGTLDD